MSKQTYKVTIADNDRLSGIKAGFDLAQQVNPGQYPVFSNPERPKNYFSIVGVDGNDVTLEVVGPHQDDTADEFAAWINSYGNS